MSRRRGPAYGGGVQGAFSLEVIADWPDIDQRITRGVRRGLEQAGDELRMSWAARLPGSMARSVRFRVTSSGTGGQAVIGSTDFRARFFESGARRHTIVPVATAIAKRTALRAFRKGLRGKARTELRQSTFAGLVAGGMTPVLRFQVGYGAGGGAYATKVRHPGMQATHPGRNAVREVLPSIAAIMCASIQREL
jgi:hypothetical protein